MEKIFGTSAAPGIAIGPCHLIVKRQMLVTSDTVENPQAEIEKLDAALRQTKTDLQHICEYARKNFDKDEADIFEAQLSILLDPELIKETKSRVEKDKANIAFAWQQTIKYFANNLLNLENEYLAARAVDVEDVGRRVLSALIGTVDKIDNPNQPSVIIADDLTPSDTITLDREKILAFCIKKGGPTSHVAILSKALGKPCLVAIGKEIDRVNQGTIVIVNGNNGEIIIDPNQKIIKSIKRNINQDRNRKIQAELKSNSPATTQDNYRVQVGANVGSLSDAREASQNGADGIGLLRTEFLFLNRLEPPSFEEQTTVYREIFTSIGKTAQIIVRTLDIGGDKPVAYMPVSPEQNPFLGVRGIRLTLHYRTLFETQIKAILTAGYGFNLCVMFPMISTLEEITQAKEIVNNCRQELQDQNIPHADNFQMGIMVEVPSVAILAEEFSRHVDFFSIGTNDLTQYVMAAERTGSDVAALNDPMHPAVLTLIKQVIKAAHDRGIWVGICGELGGDLQATPLLVGMGIDELSVTPRLIPQLKETIRNLNKSECSMLVENVLHQPSAFSVRKYLREGYSRAKS